MSSGGDAHKEFMEQLQMQELYGQRKDDGSEPYTYTDPEDGTVYDWDHEKKAWFPKVLLFLYLFAFIFLHHVCYPSLSPSLQMFVFVVSIDQSVTYAVFDIEFYVILCCQHTS